MLIIRNTTTGEEFVKDSFASVTFHRDGTITAELGEKGPNIVLAQPLDEVVITRIPEATP